MFVDYLTLMLVVMVAALIGVALFFWRGMDSSDRRGWAALFGATGMVLFLAGLHMATTWPISLERLVFANAAFGECAALLGAILLATALSLAKGWDLRPVSILALVAGAIGILVGVRIANLGLTAAPALSATGFILTGLGGMLAPLVLCIPRAVLIRRFAAVLLLIAAGLWSVTAGGAYWMHIALWAGR